VLHEFKLNQRIHTPPLGDITNIVPRTTNTPGYAANMITYVIPIIVTKPTLIFLPS
jgi:hypothetical protein